MGLEVPKQPQVFLEVMGIVGVEVVSHTVIKAETFIDICCTTSLWDIVLACYSLFL